MWEGSSCGHFGESVFGRILRGIGTDADAETEDGIVIEVEVEDDEDDVLNGRSLASQSSLYAEHSQESAFLKHALNVRAWPRA